MDGMYGTSAALRFPRFESARPSIEEFFGPSGDFENYVHPPSSGFGQSTLNTDVGLPPLASRMLETPSMLELGNNADIAPSLPSAGEERASKRQRMNGASEPGSLLGAMTTVTYPTRPALAQPGPQYPSMAPTAPNGLPARLKSPTSAGRFPVVGGSVELVAAPHGFQVLLPAAPGHALAEVEAEWIAILRANGLGAEAESFGASAARQEPAPAADTGLRVAESEEEWVAIVGRQAWDAYTAEQRSLFLRPLPVRSAPAPQVLAPAGPVGREQQATAALADANRTRGRAGGRASTPRTPAQAGRIGGGQQATAVPLTGAAPAVAAPAPQAPAPLRFPDNAANRQGQLKGWRQATGHHKRLCEGELKYSTTGLHDKHCAGLSGEWPEKFAEWVARQ